MKKLFNSKLLMLAFLLVGFGCNDLDEEVFSELTSEEFFANINQSVIDASVGSAYGSIVGTWGGHNSLYSLMEVSTDELCIGHKGADWLDGGQWLRVHRHETSSEEQSVNNGWAYCYSAIANINGLINQFNGSPEITGELRALRAVIYMWLLDAYGNVPIVIETTSDPNPPTASRTEVFNFVESELTETLSSLSAEIGDRTRVNQWTSHAALSRLYLNAEVWSGTARYADAVASADAVINSGLYSLESNFFSAFATNNDNSVEHIFALPYDPITGQGFNLPQMTLHYASQQTFDLTDQPWNGYQALEEFYNSFEEGDDRIGSFLVGPQFSSAGEQLIDDQAQDPDGPPLNFTPEINELEPNSFRQSGARVGKWEYASGSGPNLANNFALYRYAEVLFNKAEAQFRSGNTAGALDIVNQIRARANAPALAALTETDLYDDRGREFFAEGLRRMDMIRFGRYNETWWEKTVTDPTRNLFPIPKPQLDVNPNLVQNPGYSN
ncbi:MAG: RagB/SusD family nutrient uptake outer membrane protein [Cytophagales bacterium]|nr:RagB/SusD family nutrient uptake outer membrane protein [Cytophagales bacterium]